MIKLAHLSDLHFGKVNFAVVESLLADLERIAPDLIVVSGDLTERGRHAQFEAARSFLDLLPAAWLAVPGNHDVPLYSLRERFSRPTARFEHYVAADVEPVRHLNGVSVIGLNSAHGATWKHGRATAEAVDRLCAAANKTTADVKVVVAHHPFLAPPDHPNLRLIDGAGAALRRFADNQVDVVLGGHVHRAYARHAWACFPDLSRNILVVQAPTATSFHLRDEPNGYNLLTIHADRIELEVRSWREGGFRGERHARFVTAARLAA